MIMNMTDTKLAEAVVAKESAQDLSEEDSMVNGEVGEV